MSTETTTTGGAEPRAVLAFSGSARSGSWNLKLLDLMVRSLEGAGAAVRPISLRDYPLPIYDGDLEAGEGVPPAAVALRRMIADSAGLLIACPEYNGSVTPLLKNALDWCSRPGDGMGPLEPFQRKPVLIVGASISPFGGIRAIGHLRAILAKMGALVMPDDVAVPHAASAFGDEGFVSEATAAAAARAVGAFAALAR